MQRLNDLRPFLSRRVIRGRRDQREGVREVHDGGSFLADHASQIGTRLAIPNRVQGNFPRGHRANRVIVARELDHLVAIRAQQVLFVAKDLILASRLLIEVMALEDFHGRVPIVVSLPRDFRSPISELFSRRFNFRKNPVRFLGSKAAKLGKWGETPNGRSRLWQKPAFGAKFVA
jgi:hypothetical protein